MKQYLSILLQMTDYCEKFKADTISYAFTDSVSKKTLDNTRDYAYCFIPRFKAYWEVIRDIVDICDLLGISELDEEKSEMTQRVGFLHNPWAIATRAAFEQHLGFITWAFKRASDELTRKLQLLDEEEKARLNEALNCYIQGCNYAAVAMAVSAIEFRLLSLMKSVKPNPKLDEYTLGDLIWEYLQHKDEYENIIPNKHKPLLELCNQYRIFSVHPKKEKITRSIATSIINMAFAFLLDEELKHKAEAI
jgi:hypothetical protein